MIIRINGKNGNNIAECDLYHHDIGIWNANSKSNILNIYGDIIQTETGLHILDAIGGRFYYNDCGDDIVSIEIPLYDILDSIKAIDDGDFDNKFSKESIKRVRDDLMSMKIKLEQDKDDLFILYAL